MVINLTKQQYIDTINLCNGSYYPQKEFVNFLEFKSITNTFFNTKKKLCAFPIYLDIDEKVKKKITSNTKVILSYKKEKFNLKVSSIFKIDKKKYTKKLFQTSSIKHPGVKFFLSGKKYFISGKPRIIKKKENKFKKFSPKYIKSILFKKNKSICAFHTRNAPHKAHEWIIDNLLKKFDRVLIHPILGSLKKDDYNEKQIIQSFKYFLKKKKNKNLFFFPFYGNAKYGGPREALFHAIIRKNFGCSHISIGRDHAGVKNFYAKYQSQKLTIKYSKFTRIKIYSFKEPFYCKKCKTIQNKCNSCIRERIFISGSKIRKKLKNKIFLEDYIMDRKIYEILKKFK